MEQGVNIKFFDMKAHKQKYYGEILKKIDEQRKYESHTFLNKLRELDDSNYYYDCIPKSYRFMEKISNLRGKYMSTLEMVDPYPYIEMGDVAHRLVYADESMLNRDEQEITEYCRNIPLESVQLDSLSMTKVVLGYALNPGLAKIEAVRHNLLERFSASIGSIGFLNQMAEEQKMAEKARKAAQEKKALESQANLKNFQNEDDLIKFKTTKGVKYYDKLEKKIETRNFQDFVHFDENEEEAKKPVSMTAADFEEIFQAAIAKKDSLPNKKLDPKSNDYSMYRDMIEGITDLVITVNQTEVDKRKIPSLKSKIRFLLKQINGFKGVYIGNYYCPEVVMYLLREYWWMKTGVTPAAIKIPVEVPEEVQADPVKTHEMFVESIRTVKEHLEAMQDLQKLRLKYDNKPVVKAVKPEEDIYIQKAKNR